MPDPVEGFTNITENSRDFFALSIYFSLTQVYWVRGLTSNIHKTWLRDIKITLYKRVALLESYERLY